MIDNMGKIIALVISILTIRQLNCMNRKTKLEIEKLRLEIKRLRGD
ncbi:hypothetical protein [Clostridium estertheticum]|nr:hypothetical protein [Clostridium estertheticum]MBZ9615274.1 hypothetical protein [Clostridium estertheticum subsp. laramiense]WAG75163.1 hypothetical protein LL032_06860 [Clostridium estertheticum]